MSKNTAKFSSQSSSNHQHDDEEEDWSCFMTSTTGSGNNFSGYTTYNQTILQLSPWNNGNPSKKTSLTVTVDCVKTLTPYDLIGLLDGSYDSTGNLVWMGALLFIEFVVRLNECTLRSDGNKTSAELPHTAASSSLNCATNKHSSFRDLYKLCFRNKKIIELVCGTGVSGLALFALFGNKQRISSQIDIMDVNVDVVVESFVTFTDFDEHSLELFKRNCKLNNFPMINNEDNEMNVDSLNLSANKNVPATTKCFVKKLSWGDELVDSCNETDKGNNNDSARANNSISLEIDSFDTAIASDILYDIDVLPSLMKTSSELLKSGGFFILSHIPRAHVENDNNLQADTARASIVASAELLERLITNAAREQNFHVWSVIRPLDLIHQPPTVAGKEESFGHLNHVLLEEMDECGGSILIFQKTASLYS